MALPDILGAYNPLWFFGGSVNTNTVFFRAIVNEIRKRRAGCRILYNDVDSMILENGTFPVETEVLAFDNFKFTDLHIQFLKDNTELLDMFIADKRQIIFSAIGPSSQARSLTKLVFSASIETDLYVDLDPILP